MKELVIEEIRQELENLKDEQRRINNAVNMLDKLFSNSDYNCVRCGCGKGAHPNSDCEEFVRPICVEDLGRSYVVYTLNGKSLQLGYDGFNLSNFYKEEKIKLIENLDEIFLNCLKAIQYEVREQRQLKTDKINEYIELLSEKKGAEQ